MLRQQQHDAGATSILHRTAIQWSKTIQIYIPESSVCFACIARQQEQAKMAGLGGK